MKRKVIKQGHNTLTITLPANWVEKHGIKPGEEIDLSEDNDCLKLSATSEANGVSKFHLDTTELGHFKNNYISGLYHAGFDELHVKFDDPEVYKAIQKMVKASCQGYEIIDQKKDSCTIKAVTNVNEEDFENILRRIFLLFISLLEDMIDIFETGEYKRLDNIRYLEELNNRHTGYCKRILNKKGYPADPRKTNYYYVLMYDLETIADDYKHIVDYLKAHTEVKVGKPLISYLKKVLLQFRAFHELFYKFSTQNARIVFVDGRKLFDEGLTLLEDTQSRQKVVLHFFINTVMKIYEMTEPYIEMSLFQTKKQL